MKKYTLQSRNLIIRGMPKSGMPDKSWNLDIIDYMILICTELKTDWKDGVAWDRVGMAQVLEGLC